jgi:hypothetical protein
MKVAGGFFNWLFSGCFFQHKLYLLIVLEFFIGLSNISFLGLIMSGVAFSISKSIFVKKYKACKLEEYYNIRKYLILPPSLFIRPFLTCYVPYYKTLYKIPHVLMISLQKSPYLIYH